MRCCLGYLPSVKQEVLKGTAQGSAIHAHFPCPGTSAPSSSHQWLALSVCFASAQSSWEDHCTRNCFTSTERCQVCDYARSVRAAAIMGGLISTTGERGTLMSAMSSSLGHLPRESTQYFQIDLKKCVVAGLSLGQLSLAQDREILIFKL